MMLMTFPLVRIIEVVDSKFLWEKTDTEKSWMAFKYSPYQNFNHNNRILYMAANRTVKINV